MVRRSKQRDFLEAMDELEAEMQSIAAATKDVEKVRNTRERVVLMPLDRIKRRETQPRKLFREDTLDLLAENIAKNGLYSPLCVVEDVKEDVAILIDGERRWRALKKIQNNIERYGKDIKVNFDAIPVLVKGTTKDMKWEDIEAFSYAANQLSESLTYVERAAHVYKLQKRTGFSVRELASFVGESVTSTHRLVAVGEWIVENGLFDILNLKIRDCSLTLLHYIVKSPERIRAMITRELIDDANDPNGLANGAITLKGWLEAKGFLSNTAKSSKKRRKKEVKATEPTDTSQQQKLEHNVITVAPNSSAMVKRRGSVVDALIRELPVPIWEDIKRRLHAAGVSVQEQNEDGEAGKEATAD